MRFESAEFIPEKKTGNYKFSNFGFSTILLTFVMMCVVTFGVLALITANSDKKLSDKVVSKTEGYYQAKETAYGYLSDLDDLLASVDASEAEYLALAEDQINQAGVGTYADGVVSWDIPVTDTQTLHVEATINVPSQSAEGYYSITCFETRHNESSDIPDDGTLNLMGSD